MIFEFFILKKKKLSRNPKYLTIRLDVISTHFRLCLINHNPIIATKRHRGHTLAIPVAAAATIAIRLVAIRHRTYIRAVQSAVAVEAQAEVVQVVLVQQQLQQRKRLNDDVLPLQ